MDITAILVTCIIGLVIGAIAKLLMPGKDPGGCIITMLLGIAGAWLGTFLGRVTFGGDNYAAGWIMSVVGAMLLLFLYRMIAGKRS
ncbi:MAG TPA: GlsB/YeaQ/YmgE family stress response membrane protein [Chthoniobacterales bacterium]